MVATTSVTASITSSVPHAVLRVTKSFYEELRGASREDEDIENNAGADLDENNWNQHFLDQDLDGLAIEDSRTTADGREDEGDNDVPASLLVEANEAEQIGKSTHLASAMGTSAVPTKAVS
ncbi:hypothetical protein VDGE_20067 [Verticillium dahliae]|uniref:Uncharacterized protein n=1 Tax=Verticillium dahliae TaxID=27337 RepID=A0A444RJF9_VERDA|nr:hypothetical protein VDGE_20067 [Verticillium dahliae]